MKMTPRSGKQKKQPVFSQKEKDFLDDLVEKCGLTGWMAYHTYDSRRSTAGFPDLVLVKPPVVIFAELKTDKGRTSEEQRIWLEQLGLCTELEVHLWRPSDWDEIEERLGFIAQGTSPYAKEGDMSILSRLFGKDKKEAATVAEPQRKPRKPWKQAKCVGSGQLALPSQEVREEDGKRIKLGMCPECGRLGVPTKGNDLVAAHYPKPKKPVVVRADPDPIL